MVCMQTSDVTCPNCKRVWEDLETPHTTTPCKECLTLRKELESLQSVVREMLNTLWDRTGLTFGFGDAVREILDKYDIDPDTLDIRR